MKTLIMLIIWKCETFIQYIIIQQHIFEYYDDECTIIRYFETSATKFYDHNWRVLNKIIQQENNHIFICCWINGYISSSSPIWRYKIKFIQKKMWFKFKIFMHIMSPVKNDRKFENSKFGFIFSQLKLIFL